MSKGGKALAVQPAPFSYDEIESVEEREALRAAAAYGHAQDEVIHAALVRKGRMFKIVKENYFGIWERWVNAEFKMSVDKADNTIKIAQNLAEIPAGTDAIWDLRAKMLYARNSTPEEIKQLAAERARAGIKQDDDEAQIMVRAPLYLRERYLREDIAKRLAADTTRILMSKKVKEECRRALIDWEVSHPAVVAYLSQAYDDFKRTEFSKNTRMTWFDIKQDGGVLNGYGWSVPVGQANERDVQRFNADRQQMHLDKADEAWDWAVLDCDLEGLPDGRLVLVPRNKFSPPSVAFKGILKVQVRLPRDDKGEKRS